MVTGWPAWPARLAGLAGGVVNWPELSSRKIALTASTQLAQLANGGPSTRLVGRLLHPFQLLVDRTVSHLPDWLVEHTVARLPDPLQGLTANRLPAPLIGRLVIPPAGRSCRGLSIRPVGSCLLYTSPSPRDMRRSRMPSSA